MQRCQSAPGDAPPKPAAPPPRKAADSKADVELLKQLLQAVDGNAIANGPIGTGVSDLRTPKAMIASGADLDLDILPTLRRHAGELVDNPLDSWEAKWFVQEVAAAYRRRLAAQKPIAPAAPSSPAIDDAELIDRLMTAAGGNIMTGGIDDLAPVRAMMASGVALDDILSTLRAKVNRGVTKYAATLLSWGEVRFLRHVAVAYLQRTVVPGLVDGWTRAASGAAAGRVEPPAAVSVPPTPQAAPAAPDAAVAAGI